MKATLTRTWYDEKQTLGQIDCDGVTVYTLELPWKNNKRRVSCIPCGVYPVTLERHRKFGWCYRVHNVEGRSGILIHSGNYYTHTLGCILPASEQRDTNNDGLIDNVSSSKALAKLVKKNITELEIIVI